MLVSDNILTVSLLQKQDESLLEDVWTLLRAGRLEEACHLCRSAGQVREVLKNMRLILYFRFHVPVLIHINILVAMESCNFVRIWRT